MSDDLRWEDPPPDARGSNAGQPFVAPTLAALQSRPGQWARVKNARKSDQLSSHIRRLKKKGCEAVTRKQPDGTVALYACWPAEDTP